MVQRGVPQSAWLSDWKAMAAQFKGIPQVIGPASHEHANGRRWLETALLVPTADGALPPGEPIEWSELGYDIEWEPGRRELCRAELPATGAAGGRRTIVVEKLFSFRMRGIGYMHPTWGHGSAHGVLEVGREDLVLDELDPLDLSSIHVQNVVRVTLDGHAGVGVVEQLILGPHEPTGMTGFLYGWNANG